MSESKEAPRAHVIIVSDRAARGEREDQTGPQLIADLIALGYAVDPTVTVVPDEFDGVVSALRQRILEPTMRFVVTSGGTGAAPRDVTPEATAAVLERTLPGFAELMRARSMETTVYAAGSRALAGTVGNTLVVNLPGSPKGARECLSFVARPARHVVDLIAGAPIDCQSSSIVEE